MYAAVPLGIQTEYSEPQRPAHRLPTDDVVVQSVTFAVPEAVGIEVFQKPLILREVRSGGKVRVEELDFPRQQVVNLHGTSGLRAPMERHDVDYIPTTRGEICMN